MSVDVNKFRNFTDSDSLCEEIKIEGDWPDNLSGHIFIVAAHLSGKASALNLFFVHAYFQVPFAVLYITSHFVPFKPGYFCYFVVTFVL